MKAKVISWHFHWRFWKPKSCVGGLIFFGWYAYCGFNEQKWWVTKEQVHIKRTVGILEWH